MLIPKKQDAAEPSHYRPIGLCTTLYKICSKILVCRLKPILPHLIEQGAFVGSRSISDNVLIVQEFMHNLQRALIRKCLMTIKLDMERAYDRMCWEFLFQALKSFGFHNLWID